MYSLGCLIYAVHCKGNPPFKNHGSLGGLRDNAGRSIPGMEGLDTDLQGDLIGEHAIVYLRTRRTPALDDYSTCNEPSKP